jgi:hypothetical protein
VSERLVELLAPRPGQTIVDLAAGPGDTASSPRRSSAPAAGSSPPTSRRRCSTRRAERGGARPRRRRVPASRTSPPSRSTMPPSTDPLPLGPHARPGHGRARGRDPRVLRGQGSAPPSPSGIARRQRLDDRAGPQRARAGPRERPDPAAPGPFRLSADGALERFSAPRASPSRRSRRCGSSGGRRHWTSGGTRCGTRRACFRRCSSD